MQKKNETWLKPRHKVVTDLLRPVFGVYVRKKYDIDIPQFEGEGDRSYIVVFNHQTAYDQFFVSLAFKQPIYYLSSEDLFSNGLTSALIKYLVAPIPIKKQTTDVSAVKACLRVAKEGGTIGLSPEGNRTFHGRLVYIKPAIAKMIKVLKMPVAIFRIEDGFGVHPRWSDVVRKGGMRGYVSRVLEPEEVRAMSDEELLDLLKTELDTNEVRVTRQFTHKNLAERIERALYYCPHCGLTTFESHGDTFTCKQCGLTARYLPSKELQAVQDDLPYRFLADWYDAQEDFVKGLDTTQYLDTPYYTEPVSLSEVIVYKKKLPLMKRACLRVYGDRLECEQDGRTTVLRYEDIGVVTVLGKNKLNLYHADKLYQISPLEPGFNGLKVMQLYYRHINQIKEDNSHEQFLGL